MRTFLSGLAFMALASCSDSGVAVATPPLEGLRERWASATSNVMAASTGVERLVGARGFRVGRSLRAVLPENANGALELALPNSASVARVTRRGAPLARGTIERGSVVYSNGELDAIVLGTQEGIEELLVVHDHVSEIAYDVELPNAFSMREAAPRTIEIRDADDVARLRVSAPHGWDADGKEIPLELHASGGRFSISVLSRAPLPWLIDPIWTTAKSLLGARAHHTASLLPSGKILVAGGRDDNAVVQLTTELFDPATGTFTSSGKLGVARADHSATLLRTGQVLLAGGAQGSSDVATTSAELYDPASGTTAPVAPMATARMAHTATLLDDGRVLVAGGTFGLEAAEIYDPGTKKFSAAGALHAARVSHTATRLFDGEVLIFGGYADSSFTPSSPAAEIFDPKTRQFMPAAGAPEPRFGHTATIVPDGRVMLCGGASTKGALYDPTMGTFSSFDCATHAAAVLLPSDVVLLVGGDPTTSQMQIFDPLATAVQGVDALAENRESCTATLLPAGDVVIIGGESLGVSPARVLASAEVFDLDTGSLQTSVAVLPAKVTAARLTPLLDGNVLSSGGSATPATGLDVYEPVSSTVVLHAAMKVGRLEHTATLLGDGSVLLAGGTDDGTVLDSAEIFAGGSTKLTPKMVRPRTRHAALRLTSGKVLLLGGDGAQQAELYDPVAGTFRATGTMTVPRIQPLATLLPSGQVLVTGGEDASGASLASAERYDPETETFAATGSMRAARLNPAAVLLANGTVLVAGGADKAVELYNPADGTFTTAVAAMNTARAGATLTLLPSGKVVVLGGVLNPNTGATDEIYDPRLDRFVVSADSAVLVSGHAAVLLSTGNVLVAGGTGRQVQTMGSGAFSLWTPNTAPADPARRPQISAVADHFAGGSSVMVAGTSFTTELEASSGTTSSSPADVPLALWMPFGGGLIRSGVTSWGPTSASWMAPVTSLSGPGMLFLATNGIVGPGKPLRLDPALGGAACSVDSDCADAHCVDHVCCDTACKGSCMACSAKALGGMTSGMCLPIPANADPDSECLPQDVNTCGRSGGCNGAGACATYPEGAACGRGTCAKGVCTASQACVDDVTAVGAQGNTQACAPFQCRDGQCLTRCTSTSDCEAGLQCAATGECAAPAPDDSTAPGCLCGLGRRGRERRDTGAALLLAAVTLATGVRRRRTRPRTACARSAAAR
jgi:hypothetical protein